LASWDLSPEWSRAFNAKTKLTYPKTYYFSYSTSQTFSCNFGTDQCADIDIEVWFIGTANTIGDLDGVCDSDGYCFNNDWEQNDGLVPIRSSKSPQNGIPSYVAPTVWTTPFAFLPAKWYTRHYDRDHTQIIGLRLNVLTPDAANGIYTDVANAIDQCTTPVLVQTDESFEEAQDVGPSVVGGVLGALGGVLIAVGSVVVIRRRRHSARMVNVAAASKSMPSPFASPRKFSKKQLESGSLIATAMSLDEENDIVSTINPSFFLDKKQSVEDIVPESVSESDGTKKPNDSFVV